MSVCSFEFVYRMREEESAARVKCVRAQQSRICTFNLGGDSGSRRERYIQKPFPRSLRLAAPLFSVVISCRMFRSTIIAHPLYKQVGRESIISIRHLLGRRDSVCRAYLERNTQKQQRRSRRREEGKRERKETRETGALFPLQYTTQQQQ